MCLFQVGIDFSVGIFSMVPDKELHCKVQVVLRLSLGLLGYFLDGFNALAAELQLHKAQGVMAPGV